MNAVYILAWAVQAPLFFVAAQARDVPLLAARWRATSYGAKFLLALGVSTIGIKLVATTYDRTGSSATLWLALGGCAGLVALAGLFLPGRLRRAPLLTAQPAE